jgi:hypothetical protein
MRTKWAIKNSTLKRKTLQVKKNMSRRIRKDLLTRRYKRNKRRRPEHREDLIWKFGKHPKL